MAEIAIEIPQINAARIIARPCRCTFNVHLLVRVINNAPTVPAEYKNPSDCGELS